jgi:hypothetical protein
MIGSDKVLLWLHWHAHSVIRCQLRWCLCTVEDRKLDGDAFDEKALTRL